MGPSDDRADAVSIHNRTVSTVDDAVDVASTPCPVCGQERARPVFRVEGVEPPIVVCSTCGLGRFDPMLESAEVRSLYPPDYYGEPGTKFKPTIERLVRAVAARHISFLSRGLPAQARVLDVGCGRGVLVSALADRGFEVYGVEMSEDAVRGCDPRAQVRIANRLSEARFEATFFDEVVIWHVLEHMADPVDAVEECHRILKPGGRLIIAVPNFSSAQARWSGPHWFHLDPPRHLYHFPYDALRRLVEGNGFHIESSHHFSLRQNPFGWIQSALNRFTTQPTSGLYTLLHQRGRGRDLPFSWATRLAMWTSLVSLAPIAVALTLVTAWLRTGGTVHIVAIRK